MIGTRAVQLLVLCQVIQQITAATTENPPAIIECRMVKCIAECFKGVDENGCNICNCDNTCQVTKCPKGQHCIMVTDRCFAPPCGQRPQCVPDEEPKTCPKAIVCNEPCVADIGEDGCYSKCACPQTCSDIKCGSDEVCELVQVFCFRAPCFPIPTCFPKNRTCSQSPNVNRCLGKGRYLMRWTYNSGTNTCESFRHYGCNPSPNTFNSRRQCLNTCGQASSCPPNTEGCTVNCYLGETTPGACPECICPCQTVRCSSGYECRLRKEECSKGEPCGQTAYCAPTSGTPTK